jgi:hypothetical protein
MSSIEPELIFPLTPIMDALEAVERDVHPDAIVYRWRPNAPQLENGVCIIYNQVGETPHRHADIYHEQDDLTILARVGVRHSDVPDEMAMVETFATAFIQKMDPALKRIHPLGTAKVLKASRPSFRMLEDEFNDIPVLAIEFPLVFTIHRLVVPNS